LSHFLSETGIHFAGKCSKLEAEDNADKATGKAQSTVGSSKD
jgi:uncharacterized protein YjbJ (UPF0337 family)